MSAVFTADYAIYLAMCAGFILFLIGFWIKKPIIYVLSGMGFSIFAIYNFTVAVAGNIIYVWALAMGGTVMAMASFFLVWTTARKGKTLTEEMKGKYYNEDDFSTLRDMNKMRSERNKLRGRR